VKLGWIATATLPSTARLPTRGWCCQAISNSIAVTMSSFRPNLCHFWLFFATSDYAQNAMDKQSRVVRFLMQTTRWEQRRFVTSSPVECCCYLHCYSLLHQPLLFYWCIASVSAYVKVRPLRTASAIPFFSCSGVITVQ